MKESETGWFYLLSLQAPEMDRPIPHGHGYWVSLFDETDAPAFSRHEQNVISTLMDPSCRSISHSQKENGVDLREIRCVPFLY